MTRGSSKFYEIQAQFEKAMPRTPGVPSLRFDRETNPAAIAAKKFYQDGTADMLFRAYMAGYAFARCDGNLD